MNIKYLNTIEYGIIPKVLFVGNGINLLFDNGEPWSKIVEDLSNEYNVKYDNVLFSKMPMTMQIVTATRDNVDKNMKTLSEKLCRLSYTEEAIEFYSKLVNLPFEAILTTNYSYELENAFFDEFSKYKLQKSTYDTVRNAGDKESQFLYRYIKIDNERQSSLWHIHGEAYRPSTIVMGHYYYGKLLATVQNYIPDMIRRFKLSRKNREEYYPRSWVDYFMLSDVHMLGFGMDFSETDIWWLACCKKRNGQGKIFFHTMPAHITEEQKLLMEAYGIEVVKGKKNQTYKDFYNAFQISFN